MATVKAFDKISGALLRSHCLPMQHARQLRDLWQTDKTLIVTMETWTL